MTTAVRRQHVSYNNSYVAMTDGHVRTVSTTALQRCAAHARVHARLRKCPNLCARLHTQVPVRTSSSSGTRAVEARVRGATRLALMRRADTSERLGAGGVDALRATCATHQAKLLPPADTGRRAWYPATCHNNLHRPPRTRLYTRLSRRRTPRACQHYLSQHYLGQRYLSQHYFARLSRRRTPRA